MKTLLSLSLAMCCASGFAQLSITENATTYSIDFSSTVSGVNNAAFTGAGFQSSPSAGQLDANAWSITGLSDGTLAFDAAGTTGDYARGTSDGGVTTGGMYGFDVDPGAGVNRALGFQPTASDMVPGSIRLKLENSTGSLIGKLVISYKVYVLNNEARSNSVTFQHSRDNSTYYLNSASKVTSTAIATGIWTSTTRTVELIGLNFPSGGNFYISWLTQDESGTGFRDEFAIDDIEITAYTAFAFQGFEGTGNWEISSGSGKISSSTGSGDSPASQRIFSGSNSWQISNANDSLILDAFNTIGYKNIEMVLRLSSTATSGPNGTDAGDYVDIFGAYNDLAFSSSSEIRISGNFNANWSYNVSGSQVTVSNTVGSAQNSVAPASGGSRDASLDGYSFVKLSLTDGYESFRLKVAALNDASTEIWNLDHIYLTGEECSYASTQASGASASNVGGNTADISFTQGSGGSCLVLIREESQVNTFPICGTSYTANTTIGSGDELITGSGNYVVFNGSGSSFSLSGLSPNTTYYLRFFDRSGTDYNTPGYDFSFTTCDSEGIGVDEAFDAGTTAPSKWTFTNIGGTYTSAGNFGAASPSLQMDNTGDQITTPVICNTPTALSFWIKGQGTDASSALLVEGSSDGDSWTSIDNIGDLPDSDADAYQRQYGAEAISAYNQFRFTYSKSVGNLAIDDIRVFSGESGGSSYSWDNGGSGSDWATVDNWNPARDDFGVEDELIFNDGASYTITNLPTQSIQKLQITNGSSVNISGVTGGSDLYINGDGSDSDNFYICSTCSLTLSGTNPIRIHLLNERDGTVEGSLIFSGSKAHQILVSGSNSLTFSNGSFFRNTSTNSTNGTKSPFGQTTIFNGKVVFESGSNYYSSGSAVANPFGLDAPNSAVTFNSGSNFYYENNGLAPTLNGRAYGNFYFNRNATVTVTTGSSGLTVDSLVVLDGTFKINAAYTTTINGNMAVRGGDSLVFAPSSAQNINLNASAGLLQATTGGIRIGGNVTLRIASGSYDTEGYLNIQGNLTHNGTNFTLSQADSLRIEGVLTNTGTFIIEDDAALIQTSSSTLSNSGTFQASRNIPDGGSSGYYYFWSSPMTGGSGAEIGSSGELSGSLMYEFTSGGNQQSDYSFISSTTPMVPGKGYAVLGESAVTVSGTVNNGDIDISITENDGSESYSLIGNPYPSSINADAFMSENSSNLEGTIYLWSYNDEENYEGNKQYIAVNSAGSSGTHDRAQNLSSTYIASFQGFMVEANESQTPGPLTISFNNSMRNGANSDFKSSRKPEILNKMWLYLSADKDTAAALLAITKEASFKYDQSLDARAMSSPLRVAYDYNGIKHSILSIPEIPNGFSVPLHFKAPKSGWYQVGLIQNSPFTKSKTEPFLLDKQNFQNLPLAHENQLIWLEKGDNADRYFLIFGRTASPTTGVDDSYRGNFLRLVSDGSRYIQIWGAAKGREYLVKVISYSGQTLIEQGVKNKENVDISRLSVGPYILRVFSDNEPIHNEAFVKF